MTDDSDKTWTCTIEEIVGQDKIKVTLEGHDTPFGMPRKHEVFALGGENERELIRLQGRSTPIIHTKWTVWEPTVLKGHLRDHFEGNDGHGREIVKQLQDILDNQRLCKLSLGAWTWTVFPQKFRLPVEGLNDFTYELKFDVLVRPDYKPPIIRDHGPLNPYPFDLTSEVRQLLAEARATLLAQQILVDVLLALTIDFDAVDAALSDTLVAAQAFENSAPKSLAEPRLMSAAAQGTKDRCDDLYAALASLTPSTALTAVDEATIALFQAEQLATLGLVDECKTRMRSLQYTANQRARATTKLYRVAKGDTLDMIATQQLGSAARALEINLREQDLKAGRLIRLPA